MRTNDRIPALDELGSSPPALRTLPPGPESRALAARLGRLESPAFGTRRQARAADGDPAPIVYAGGRGSNVVDVDGNVYVDLSAGFGALALGHNPRPVRHALDAQADVLWQALGDLHSANVKVTLLEKLAAIHPDPKARVLLGQSGSDAVTAALKTAALTTGKPGVLAFEGAYHGLGYGPLSALGLAPGWREPFAEQLNRHVHFVPYPGSPAEAAACLDRARAILERNDIGAILIEPILGRGGVVVPPPGFLRELSSLAKNASALLVVDEIWTGLGRSGSWLYSLDAGVTPDLVCLGKSLGGGLPISACIGSDEAMQGWRREPSKLVVHTATFHGAPLACATAIATLDVLREERLAERAAAVGARFSAKLAKVKGVAEVRGRGLMIGLRFEAPFSALVLWRELLERGYVTTLGGRASEVLVLTPALTIDEGLLDAFVHELASTLEASA